ncbi:type II toxin-antitoxin system RelE/ParE family toxin [uncultured Tateyamaria sp.]|uniref:type II toxin-antitoxin system RelE/ParE family toxin n=1 Tax=uncultured Tateyamaria sp. TaxID=455651 RepID=UPI00260CF213|nr:type II toxin-antitoxin system RelE/ParE family toxin [uncultured Tateyamaria sp.]
MPKGYNVFRSSACEADIEAIFDHLFQSYCDLGDPVEDALNRAAVRVRGIEDTLAGLGEVPFQGTLMPHILDGLRHVTKDNAVFYFIADEARAELRVLAVFFGGQDHKRHILRRILGR